VNVPRVVLACGADKHDENVRHITVVTGNRMPPGSDGLKFRLEGVPNVVKGGEPVVKAVLLGKSGEDMNELCQSGNRTPLTKMMLAATAMLERLETASAGLNPKALSEEVGAETDISAATIDEAKTWLKKQELIRFIPERDEAGTLRSWRVVRTQKERPPQLQTSHSVMGYGVDEAASHSVATPPDTIIVGSSYREATKWLPDGSHSLPLPTSPYHSTLRWAAS